MATLQADEVPVAEQENLLIKSLHGASSPSNPQTVQSATIFWRSYEACPSCPDRSWLSAFAPFRTVCSQPFLESPTNGQGSGPTLPSGHCVTSCATSSPRRSELQGRSAASGAVNKPMPYNTLSGVEMQIPTPLTGSPPLSIACEPLTPNSSMQCTTCRRREPRPDLNARFLRSLERAGVARISDLPRLRPRHLRGAVGGRLDRPLKAPGA